MADIDAEAPYGAANDTTPTQVSLEGAADIDAHSASSPTQVSSDGIGDVTDGTTAAPSTQVPSGGTADVTDGRPTTAAPLTPFHSEGTDDTDTADATSVTQDTTSGMTADVAAVNASSSPHVAVANEVTATDSMDITQVPSDMPPGGSNEITGASDTPPTQDSADMAEGTNENSGPGQDCLQYCGGFFSIGSSSLSVALGIVFIVLSFTSQNNDSDNDGRREEPDSLGLSGYRLAGIAFFSFGLVGYVISALSKRRKYVNQRNAPTVAYNGRPANTARADTTLSQLEEATVDLQASPSDVGLSAGSEATPTYNDPLPPYSAAGPSSQHHLLTLSDIPTVVLPSAPPKEGRDCDRAGRTSGDPSPPPSYAFVMMETMYPDLKK